MSFCLFFLTGINFVVYSPSFSCSAVMGASDEESSTPVEEKSSSKTGVTVQEEYIHDHHYESKLDIAYRSKHRIPSVEKLQIVHYELVSPPPKS